MTSDEVSKRFPGVQSRPSYDHPEISNQVEIRPGVRDIYSEHLFRNGNLNTDIAQRPELQGVQKVELRFIDNKAASLRLTYDDTHDLSFDDTYFHKLSKSLNLKGEWSPALQRIMSEQS